MMGHRSKLVGGDEYDALTRFKRFLEFGPGVRKKIKRQHNKRVRAQHKNLDYLLDEVQNEKQSQE